MKTQLTVGLLSLGLFVLALVAIIPLMDQPEVWVETPCEVVSTSYEERKSYRSGRHTRSIRGTYYVPKVVFKYQVDGETYFGDKYSGLSPSYKRISAVEKSLAELKLTSYCFVAANEPHQAMLKNPPPSPEFVATFFPLVSVAFGIMLCVMFVKH